MVRRLRRADYADSEHASALSDHTVGLLWLAGGCAVTFVTFIAAGHGGVYVVAWGAMLYGIVKIAGTMADGHDEDGQPLAYKDRIVLGQELALRAMFFISESAGGDVSAREAAIQTSLWRMTEREIPIERQAELRAETTDQGEAFLDFARSERARIAPSFIDITLDVAAQIAAIDGPPQPATREKLVNLADALNLSAADVDAALGRAQG